MFKTDVRRLSHALVFAASFGVAAGASAQATPRNFSVSFSNCSEFVGIGPVPLDKAQAALPPGVIAGNFGGTARIVVRISNCQPDALGNGGVSVAGGPFQAGTLAQVGITTAYAFPLVENYTLTYATNVRGLATQLRAAGLPAQYDRDMQYLFTKVLPAEPADLEGNVLGLVSSNPGPAWAVYGRASDDPFLTVDFQAIWTHKTGNRTVKMDTMFTSIAFSGASVSFHTGNDNLLSRVIGNSTIASFGNPPSADPQFSVRGVFANAQMEVTVQ